MLNARKDTFKLFTGISVFSRFLNFVPYGPFKKCSGVIFRVLDEKLTIKHALHPIPKNMKLDLVDLVSLDDLDMTQGHRMLRTVLRGTPDTIHAVSSALL